MDLSETILAAMIGAIATLSTALFQLFNAFRSGSKTDPKVKRGSALRSVLSVMALMVASAVGGFLFSEFLKQRSVEEMRAMRDDLREVKELAAMAAGRLPAAIVVPALDAVPAKSAVLQAAAAASVTVPAGGSAESVVYVPACRPFAGAAGATECAEAEAQRVALCGTVPALARVETFELFAQPDAIQQPWEQHAARLEQDLGGARFTGRTFEYAQSTEHKAVCVNFTHWSSAHPHLARLVVRYDFGTDEAMGPAVPVAIESQSLPPSLPPALPIITVDSSVLAPQSASFIASGPAAAQ